MEPKEKKKTAVLKSPEERLKARQRYNNKVQLTKQSKENSAIKSRIRGNQAGKNVVLNLDDSADKSYAKKIRNYSATRSLISKSTSASKSDLISKVKLDMKDKKKLDREKSLTKPNLSKNSLSNKECNKSDGRSSLPTSYATIPLNDKSIKSKNKMNKSKLGKPISVNLFNENSEEKEINTDGPLDLKNYLSKSSDSENVLLNNHEDTSKPNKIDSVGKAKVVKMNLDNSKDNEDTKEENVHPNVSKENLSTIKIQIEDKNLEEKIDDQTPLISKPPSAQPQMPKPNMQKTQSKTHRGSPKESHNAFCDEFVKVDIKKRKTKDFKVDSILENQSKLINKIAETHQTVKFDDVYIKLQQYDMLYARLQESNKCLKSAHMNIFYFLNTYKELEEKVKNIKNSELKNKVGSLKSINLSIDEFEDCITKNGELFNSINYMNDCEEIVKRIKSFDTEISNVRSQIINDQKLINSESKKTESKREQNWLANTHDNINYGIRYRIDLSQQPSKVNSIQHPKDFSEYSKNVKSGEISKNSGQNSTKSKLSPNKLEIRIDRLQSELAEKVQSESTLLSDNQKLKTELDSLKKLMENNKYYLEIKETISNISEAIFNSSVKHQIEVHHQAMLKSLIDESLSKKMQSLEEKSNLLQSSLEDVKHKLKDEVRRSQESYGICRKYISTIKGCAKMQQDFVDISDYIKNAELDTVEDLELIENNQFLTTQNNKVLRRLSDIEIIGMLKEEKSSPKNLMQQVNDRDKYIQKLEHKIQIREEGKKRMPTNYKKLSKSSHQEKYNSQIETSSSKRINIHERLLPISHNANNKKKQRNRSINSRDQLDPKLLEMLNSNEPDPEPTSFGEVDGIISQLPESK